MSARIVIGVPVLGRPGNAEALYRSWTASTYKFTRLVVLATAGDDETIAAWEPFCKPVVLELDRPGHGEWAQKLNWLYAHSDEEFILCGADDLRFHAAWDSAVLEVASEGWGVIGTNDLGNSAVTSGQHATHPVVSRHYIDACGTVDECGKLLHEGYNHQMVDVELVETAKARGAWAFAAESHVEHLHPFWRKSVDDDTYRLGREHYTADQQLYRRRQRLWAQVAA